MDEGHRAGSRLRSRAGAAAAQVLLDGIEEAAQGAVEGLVVVLEMVAQPFGQGQHPLTHRQAGQDMIGQVGGGLERGALVLLVSSTRYYPAQCNRLFNRATRHGPSGCFASQRQGWCARPGAPRKKGRPVSGSALLDVSRLRRRERINPPTYPQPVPKWDGSTIL